MKNTITFETSRALKEAGFPQPEPEPGQVWWSNDGYQIIVISRRDNTMFPFDVPQIMYSIGGQILRNPVATMSDRFVFAPTAADILGELPETTLLSRIENDFQCRIMSKDFERCEYARRDGNPAEACAAAYLEINKNPKV